MHVTRPRLPVALIVATLAVTRVVASNDGALQRAKALYEDAAYELALAELDALQSSPPSVAVSEYRILCLLALDRAAEAELAADAMVLAAPDEAFASSEFPPRFVKLVREARARLLPRIVSAVFHDAREHYRRAESAAAQAGFARVLTLSSGQHDGDLDEVRTMASRFLDLLQARAAAGADLVIAPVAINQALPAWTPPKRDRDEAPRLASLHIVIGVDGRVKTAVMQRATDSDYDALLLQATRDWLYTPATINGVAVEADKFIDLQLDAVATRDTNPGS
jgi:hypothetical protein